MIKTKEPLPLPLDVDENIHKLISSMLQKDPINRPTIFEIASQKCIHDEIQKFVEEEDCADAVQGIYNGLLSKEKKKLEELKSEAEPFKAN